MWTFNTKPQCISLVDTENAGARCEWEHLCLPHEFKLHLLQYVCICIDILLNVEGLKCCKIRTACMCMCMQLKAGKAKGQSQEEVMRRLCGTCNEAGHANGAVASFAVQGEDSQVNLADSCWHI